LSKSPLVANRADNSISVLSIQGKDVQLVDTVPMGEQVAAVAFTPDGKRALAVTFPGHKAALLEVDGQKVTYTKYDMNVGLWPYNIGVTPNGKLAITANNGAAGNADGHVDTVSIIDLEATPPRVIDHVVVGDAPEGFAISPTGEIAVAILLNGSDGPWQAPLYNKNGRVAVLKIDGKTVTKIGDVEVGGLPEGAVFSQDGKYLYVGNFNDRDVSILKVDGTNVTDTGKRLQLPGHPASMRGGPDRLLQLLRRDRGAARVRVQQGEAGREVPEGLVHHRPDWAEGMVLGDPLFRLNVAPHVALLGIAAAHAVASS